MARGRWCREAFPAARRGSAPGPGCRISALIQLVSTGPRLMTFARIPGQLRGSVAGWQLSLDRCLVVLPTRRDAHVVGDARVARADHRDRNGTAHSHQCRSSADQCRCDHRVPSGDCLRTAHTSPSLCVKWRPRRQIAPPEPGSLYRAHDASGASARLLEHGDPVEFGIELPGKTSSVLVAPGASAHLKVGLTWRPAAADVKASTVSAGNTETDSG
jgi:hypothetical protein